MNKTELIAKVAEKQGVSKKEGAPSVEKVFDTISEALKSGEKVSIPG